MAKTIKTKTADTSITIPGRYSYAHVYVPTKMKNGDGTEGKAKYSTAFMWPKKDKATTAVVKKAYEAAVQQGKDGVYKGREPKKGIRDVIHDGDTERSDNAEYKGMYFVSAKSDNAPTVTKVVGGKLVEIFEPEFYSGCMGKLNINLYPYNASGSTGVAVGLNHCLKTGDAERLSGRGTTADVAFGSDLDSDDLDDDGLDDFDDLG